MCFFGYVYLKKSIVYFCKKYKKKVHHVKETMQLISKSDIIWFLSNMYLKQWANQHMMVDSEAHCRAELSHDSVHVVSE